MKNKIKWYYHYIEKCNEITSNDSINIVPDKFGRWQLRGKIEVETKLLGKYKTHGKRISIPLATIQYNETIGFHCNFRTIYDANIGICDKLIRGETPNEIMDLVEKEFQILINIFKSLK